MQQPPDRDIYEKRQQQNRAADLCRAALSKRLDVPLGHTINVHPVEGGAYVDASVFVSDDEIRAIEAEMIAEAARVAAAAKAAAEASATLASTP